jgi:hypothetical protein
MKASPYKSSNPYFIALNHSIVWAVFVLCLLTACCRESDPPTPEPEEPLVRNGQMYALVDGEEWRSCGPITAPKTGAQNFIGDYLDISGNNYCGKGSFYFQVFGFFGEGEYPLGGFAANLGLYQAEQNFITNRQYGGILTITKVDSTDLPNGNRLPAQISGTFSFTALGSDSTSTITVTKGQFVKLRVYNF